MNLPTPYNNHVFVDPSPNSTTTISCRSANSAKSSTPLLQGWKPSLRGWTPQSKNICHQHPIPHQRHLLIPQPLLPLPNTSPNFHIIYAHACHVHTTPPPSPTAKPASLWNTETSSQTPPHVPHGCTPPQTNLVASHKASQTTVWNLPTLYSLFLSPRSPLTNNLPMPILSAATVPKI